jgi:hypothetical protein
MIASRSDRHHMDTIQHLNTLWDELVLPVLAIPVSKCPINDPK